MNTQKLIPDSMHKDIWSNHNNSRVILISILMIMTISAVVTVLMYISIDALLIVFGAILGMLVIIACLNKPAWILYFTLFVIFLPAGLIPASIQSLLNRSMTVITLGVWLLSLIIFRRKIFLTSAATMMCGFIIWSIITLFWADIDAAKTTLQVYALRFLLFVFLIPNEIRTVRKLNGLLSTMALSGWAFLIVNVVVLIQQGYTPSERFKVFNQNENEAGLLFLLMMVGILWAPFKYSKSRRTLPSIVAFIFLIFSIIFIVISGSRGSAISLSITLLAFWFWPSTRPWGKLSLFILLIAMIVAPTLFITTLGRFIGFASLDDTLLGGREAIWSAAWSLISEHSLIGVGIGGSPYALLSYLQVKISNIGADGVSMHNPILTVWGETGILGIILYLGILVSAIWSFAKQYLRYKKRDVDGQFTPYFSLVASVFLGYMVSWFKGGGMQTHFTYFLLLALLLIPSGMDINEILGKVRPTSPLEINSLDFTSSKVLESNIKLDNNE